MTDLKAGRTMQGSVCGPTQTALTPYLLRSSMHMHVPIMCLSLVLRDSLFCCSHALPELGNLVTCRARVTAASSR